MNKELNLDQYNICKDVVFRPTTYEDIEAIKPRMFLDAEQKIMDRLQKTPEELIIKTLDNSYFAYSAIYKNTPLIVFGINKQEYKEKPVIWMFPDTKSQYKKMLSYICKKIIKPITKSIVGDFICFEPKCSPIGIRWVEFLGGKIVGEEHFSDTDFYVINFGGR